MDERDYIAIGLFILLVLSLLANVVLITTVVGLEKDLSYASKYKDDSCPSKPVYSCKGIAYTEPNFIWGEE